MAVIRTIFMLAPAIFGVAAAVPMDGVGEPITRVAVVRGLPREGAAKALAVKLTGVVTYMGWENFVMHDGDASVFVDFHFSQTKGYWQGAVPDLASLEPGAGVEVEGVTDPGGFSPMVLVTKFRRIGAQMMPPPRRPPIERLLAGAEDTQWVEVEGVVKKCDTSGKRPDCLTLVVHGHPCPVVMRTRLKRSSEQLVDARVRVRGVVLNLANLRSQVAGLKIHSNGDQDIDILVPPPADPFQAPRVALNRLIPFAPEADLDHRKVSSGVATFVVPGRFFYLFGDGACVRVVSTPPWWSPQRMAMVLTVVLLVLVLALVWGYAMRRQVVRRSVQLAEEIAARGAATLEFDAILGERRRLANDLHDTLEQALTGLALQLEITERAMWSEPELSARHLHLAQQFLERSRREVHRTVWDLRAHGLDGRDFLDVLHERVADMVKGSAVAITVDRDGAALALPDLLAGNLLLLAQEAVTNALKHAAPGKIDIRLKFSDAAVELSVKDDGRGFDRLSAPGQYDGHFGLQGMHERVKRLAGWLAINSSSGQGTRITVRVPLPDDLRMPAPDLANHSRVT